MHNSAARPSCALSAYVQYASAPAGMFRSDANITMLPVFEQYQGRAFSVPATLYETAVSAPLAEFSSTGSRSPGWSFIVS